MSACRICGAALVPSRFTALGLRACPACGAEFAAAPGTGEYASDAYLQSHLDIQWDAAQRAREARMRVRWVTARVASGRLYEAGAAAGAFLDAARRHGFAVRGVEPSPALSAHARDVLGLDVVTGFVEEQPPPREPADVGCLWHVVEHAEDPIALLRATAAQIAPGGLLFLEVPNVASPVAQRLGARWPALGDRSHVTHFTPRALRLALERAGVRPLELVTLPRWVYRAPAARMRPRAAASLLRDVWLSRGVLGSHPARGDLLRAVARR